MTYNKRGNMNVTPFIFMRLEGLKMGSTRPKCIKSMVLKRGCLYCKGSTIIHGYTKTGKCRYKCQDCAKTFQKEYCSNACRLGTNKNITTLLKEGVGIRSTSRLLKISTTTVTKRILMIADKIKKPQPEPSEVYEVDELRTYIGNKMNLIWIAYAMNRQTRQVVNFNIGKRTNEMLRSVIYTVLQSDAKKIYTDKLLNYRYLVPKALHNTKVNGINHIERNNLTLRTHLKRLNRKTIYYGKNVLMLMACIKIYFWG